MSDPASGPVGDKATDRARGWEWGGSHTAQESTRRKRLLMTFEAFGVRFAVRLGDAEPLPYLHNYLPYGSVAVPDGPAEGDTFFALRRRADGFFWQTFKGRRRICETQSLSFAMDRLHHSLVGHVAAHTPAFTFVHAGAIVWKGRALIIPGDGFSGKSTLVRRLVEAGATYYSDDIAVIDGEGRLHPYRRTLRFREPDAILQRPFSFSDATGGVRRFVKEPVPVCMVAFSMFDREGSWRREDLSPGSFAVEGLRHTLGVRSDPGRHLRTWATVAGAAEGFRWQRGEAKEAAKRLLGALESRPLPR